MASELLSRKTEMDKVYRAYIDDEIDMKSFGSQYRPLEKRRDLCYLPSSKTMTSKQRKFIPALPFCKNTLKAQKPASFPYPKRLKTLGGHLRKKRLDIKLQQKEVAEELILPVFWLSSQLLLDD